MQLLHRLSAPKSNVRDVETLDRLSRHADSNTRVHLIAEAIGSATLVHEIHDWLGSENAHHLNEPTQLPDIRLLPVVARLQFA